MLKIDDFTETETQLSFKFVAVNKGKRIVFGIAKPITQDNKENRLRELISAYNLGYSHAVSDHQARSKKIVKN